MPSSQACNVPGSIPFSLFCSLLYEISRAPSHKAGPKHRYRKPDYPALHIFNRWISKVTSEYSPLRPGTTATIFKLLFPQEDHLRRFSMQENRLSQYIADCFGVERNFLDKWLPETASGCLGEELKLALERTSPCTEYICSLSIAQVDELLDELASTSGYTDATIRCKYSTPQRRSKLSIMKDLFCTLSPTDAGFLAQVILKDLRPIIYPSHDTHYTAALLNNDSTSVKMLTTEDAMSIWDPSMLLLNSYRVRATLSEAANEFESSPIDPGPVVPKIGIPVTVPKSEKGRGLRHALSYFHPSHQVWAETKYDGERAQIHVDVNCKGLNIKIFSKSKRDSTWDRMALHNAIHKALKMPRHGLEENQTRVQRNVILDAEMVAFYGHKIDEFWRIRGLIERSAMGIRGKYNNASKKLQRDPKVYSQSSMLTNENEDRRLGLVFFDILTLDSLSLLTTPYHRRRQILEDIIQTIPGECMLSERVPVANNTSTDNEHRIKSLRKIFSDSIAKHQEGLVLKGDNTIYHDPSTPWVKLKRDYIPGYGDALDMVVLGIGWDKERARVLRVPPSTITTFYVGCLENEEAIKCQPSERPHFHVYFTVSYGLSRRELEDINFRIQNSEKVTYNKSMEVNSLDYTFTLRDGLAPPRAMLNLPLLAEIFGAGFTKSPKSRHYELRFPRLAKIFRPYERGWQDGVISKELHKIACDAIGRDCSSKEAKDINAEIWGLEASPGARTSVKRKASNDLWEERLAGMDKRDSHMSGTKRSKDSLLHTGSIRGSKSNPAERHPVPFQDGTARPSLLCPSPALYLPSKNTSPLHSFIARSDILQASHQFDEQELDINLLRRPGIQKPDSSFTQTKTVLSKHLPPTNTPQIQSPKLILLQHALVWHAKPHSKASSWYYATYGQQLHSIESFLIGCGWSPHGRGCANWAERGIIFLEENPLKNDILSRLKIVSDRLDALSATNVYQRKPIWVLERCKWDLEHVNVEDCILRRFE